jgi:cytochrome c biogenesis protein CcmG/thiol:disulfide interchange protein DsbE
MRSWLKLAVLALVAIAAMQAYTFVRGRGSREAIGETAPGFTLLDTDGKYVSLASLKGRVVVVNFWATWCPPCRAEIPELSRLYAENRGKCFELLGVAEESGPREAIVETAEKLGANYPILLDERGDVANTFRIGGYPHTFLIDAKGKVRASIAGGIDGRELRQALDPLLREAPTSCPRA